MFNLIPKFSSESEEIISVIDDEKEQKLMRKYFDKWKLFYEKKKQEINEQKNDDQENDEIYVIMVDNIPYYYEYDLKNAKMKILNMAKKICTNHINNEIGIDENDVKILINNDLEIDIIVTYDFILTKYTQTLYSLKIENVVPTPF